MNKQFIKKIINHEYFYLILLMLFWFSMLLIRYAINWSTSFLFFFLNVFLWAIPFMLSIIMKEVKFNKFIFIILWILFILFLPNAAYLVTDLKHINLRSFPLRYDTMFFAIFAMVWIMFFNHSIYNAHIAIKEYFTTKLTKLFVPLAIISSAVGIYLGRFLRYHSIHVFAELWNVIRDLFDHAFISHILQFWPYTITIWIFMTINYMYFLHIKTNRNQ